MHRSKRTIMMAGWLSLLMSGGFGCHLDAEDLESSVNDAVESGVPGTQGHQDVVGTAFVHLFEWRWPDIARECEEFLGPKGFEAVQVSPPNEHIDFHTWWARYQPVSYQLESRGGTRGQFIDMVQRCNAAGVAIYVDAVINHTAALNGGGVGVAGTPWSTKNHPVYSPQDYHFSCPINNYGDRGNVQFCELSGLPDLNTGSGYVQDQIAGYLNDLQSLGVAGFRIDAGKHMASGDIAAILNKAGNPYVFTEVIGAPGEAVQPGEYTHLGQVTEFGYSSHIGHRFLHGQIADLDNIADGKLAGLSAVVFVDNHDNQRGHGGGGEPVTHKNGELYNLANAFMLAHPYGYPKVMSSYEFSNGDQGPPGPGGCGSPGWICEHRRTPIANMVGFRNVTNGQGVTNWWDNGNNRLAFSRGNKGFIAINKENGFMQESLQTGLPAGTYCNIAAGDVVNGQCTGPTVTVNSNGSALIQVNSFSFVAIHAESLVDGSNQTQDGDVLFTCNNGHTTFGQSVYVIGNIPELGNWNLAGAVRMDPTNYPTWSKTIHVGTNRSVAWKCLKRDEVDPNARVEWQSGADISFTTPSSGLTTSTGGF